MNLVIVNAIQMNTKQTTQTKYINKQNPYAITDCTVTQTNNINKIHTLLTDGTVTQTNKKQNPYAFNRLYINPNKQTKPQYHSKLHYIT